MTTLHQGDALAACGGLRDWHGCYSGQTALLTEASFAHPAKMSASLCYRILEHLEELGLLKPGDTVLDPMCGVSTFQLAACVKGYSSIGGDEPGQIGRLIDKPCSSPERED